MKVICSREESTGMHWFAAMSDGSYVHVSKSDTDLYMHRPDVESVSLMHSKDQFDGKCVFCGKDGDHEEDVGAILCDSCFFVLVNLRSFVPISKQNR